MFLQYLSAGKILVRTSKFLGQVQPFACKPNTENIRRKDDPPSRILLVQCFSLSKSTAFEAQS